MSLINRMLQDLDARNGGSSPVIVPQPAVRPVGEADRGRSLAIGLIALIVLAGAGGGWYWYSSRNAATTQAAPAPVAAAAKRAAVPEQTGAPSGQPASVAGAASVPVVTAQASSAQAATPAPAPAQIPASTVVAKADTASPASSAAAPIVELAPQVAAAKVEKQKPTQPSVVAAAPVAAKKVRAESPQPEMPVQSAPAPEPVKVAATTPRDASPLPAKQIRELTPYQRAENEYRRASGLSMQGRTSEAMAALEQALQIDPRHAAARQMHAGMLVEAGRTDEAIASLKAGIALDQTQPSLAMSLARLQVEKGDAKGALETLRGGLPYAADFADYHAFLGALLQRQELHKEAVDEYGAALRLVPQNGLWWMGMGISLQADNRPKEARDAYQRAKAANTLSAELQSFVDQKLAQLPK